MNVGNSVLENVDSGTVVQFLLGGMTVAMMWNKKQIHGGF